MPFFPRVDVALVGLDHRVPQGVAIEEPKGVLLEPMPQPQEVLAVAAQLAGEPRRGGGLGDAAEDQQELGRRPPDAVQGRPGEGVEDAAARAALVIDEGVAMAAVDAEAFPFAASRAGEPVGVEEGDELVVAGVLVHQVGQGEVHRRGSRPLRAVTSIELPADSNVKRPSTGSAT